MMPPEYQTTDRMEAKRRAIPLPDLRGKAVLDVGCDEGYWSFLAEKMGAAQVLGLDRGREIRGRGWVDLVQENRERAGAGICKFARIDLGRQWYQYGKFDVIFLFSLYHHIFQNTGGDHRSIWFWLACHLDQDGLVLWENPVDTNDPVVRMNVDRFYHSRYSIGAILSAAVNYFHAEYIGPALHETTRDVYQFTRRPTSKLVYYGEWVDGAGGATKAFQYENARRIAEIKSVIGVECVPGSLNVKLFGNFEWDHNYFRAQILDVKDRAKGLESEWLPRWARFYPVIVNEDRAWGFRFEGESYPHNFVELISDVVLKDSISSSREVVIQQ